MWFNAKVCDHPLSLRQISSSSFFLAPLPSDLSVMDMIEKVIFQSQQWLALLPASMREVLMTCHSLDYSLAPDAAEQSILQHIFQALCFVDKSPPLTHCCLIQSHFGSLQLCMGMRPLELMSCSDTTAYVDYLTNCQDGLGWTVDSAAIIPHIHTMNLNELLILCRIHSLAVTDDDSSQPLLVTDLRTTLLQHLLTLPCNVNFDSLQPANTQCISLPPNTALQRRSSTLIALADHKITCKLTTELLFFHEIQHSESDSLKQMWTSLKQYAKKLLNSSTPKQCVTICIRHGKAHLSSSSKGWETEELRIITAKTSASHLISHLSFLVHSLLRMHKGSHRLLQAHRANSSGPTT